MVEIITISKENTHKLSEYLNSGWVILHSHGQNGVVTFVLHKSKPQYALVAYDEDFGDFTILTISTDRANLMYQAHAMSLGLDHLGETDFFVTCIELKEGKTEDRAHESVGIPASAK